MMDQKDRHRLESALECVASYAADRKALLDAMQEILNVRVNGWDNIWAGASRCQDIARAAIAKAEGRA